MITHNRHVGYHTYQEFQRVEKIANELGFKLGPSRYNYDQDYISLYPLDEGAVPVYTRDANIFTGTLADVDSWLHGIMWAREYDKMLGVSDSKKRARREQDHRNKQLVSILKQEKQI